MARRGHFFGSMRRFGPLIRLWGKGVLIFADLQFVYDKFATMSTMRFSIEGFASGARRACPALCRLLSLAMGFQLARVAR